MPSHVTLEILNGPGEGSSYLFDKQTECLVGRAADCTIRFENVAEYIGLGIHHSVFEIDPPLIWLHDLGTRLGTYINGTQIESGRDKLNQVRHGDLVRVGPMLVAVEVVESQDGLL